MANLGQITNELQDYINSPINVPKLGNIDVSANYQEQSQNKPRLAETPKYSIEDIRAYKDKPWYDDVGAVGKAIGAGAVVELPEMVGRAAQAYSPEESSLSKWGKSVVQSAQNRAKDWEVDMRGRGDVAKAFIEGGKMIAPSLAALPAYLAGPAVGTAATLALYGGSQYQDVYDRAKANGLNDDQAHRAGLLSGAIEGGGEAIANKFSLGLLGVGKRAASQAMAKAASGLTETSVIKPLAKEYGKALVGENITEGLQQYGENLVESEYGISPEKSLGESFGETFGPTTAMTTLLAPFGIAGHYANAKNAERANARAQAVNTILDDPSASTPEERLRVVDMIHTDAINLNIPKEQADAWRTTALSNIKNNEPITRYQEEVGSKEGMVQPEKDVLPSGYKVTDKAIGKYYTKYLDIFNKTKDPTSPEYQESYSNITSSLNNIINPGEGKTVDPVKREEAQKTLDAVERAHNFLVKGYDNIVDAGKSEEEIIQSQKESDESAKSQIKAEEEELTTLTSNKVKKVDAIEETLKDPEKDVSTKTSDLLSKLDEDISGKEVEGSEISPDELKGLMEAGGYTPETMDEKAVEPVESTPEQEEVPSVVPTPEKAVEESVAPRIDLEAFKGSLKEETPVQTVPKQPLETPSPIKQGVTEEKETIAGNIEKLKQARYDKWDSLPPQLKGVFLKNTFNEDELRQAAIDTFGTGIDTMFPFEPFVNNGVPLQQIESAVKKVKDAKQIKETTETNASSSSLPSVRKESGTKTKGSTGVRTSRQETRQSTVPKAQEVVHPAGTRLVLKYDPSYGALFKGKDNIIGEVTAIITTPKKNKVSKYRVKLEYLTSEGKVAYKEGVEVGVSKVLGVQGESITLSDSIKQQTNSNKVVGEAAVSISENPEEATPDDIELASEDIEVDPVADVTIDSLLKSLYDNMDEIDVAPDKESKLPYKEANDKIIEKLKAFNQVPTTFTNKEYRKYTTIKPDNMKVAAQDTGYIDDEVSEDELEQAEIEPLDGFIVSDDTGTYSNAVDIKGLNKIEAASLKEKQDRIALNKKLFSKLVEQIDPNAKFSIGKDKAIYESNDIVFIFIDDFGEYGSDRFEREEGFSQYSAKSSNNSMGFIKQSENEKPKVYLNGNNASRLTFIGTFIHEVVGHYGVRKLLESRGHKYKNFLLHLINTDKNLRQAILDKYQGWMHYHTSHIKKVLGLPADYKLTTSEADKYFNTLKEGIDFIEAVVPYGDKKVKVKIPIDVATRYADEYIAELAKELYFDKEFNKNYVKHGVKENPLRVANRIRLNKRLDRILDKIKHILRSVFGSFINEVTHDDLWSIIAASQDNIFNKIDPGELLDVKINPKVVSRPILTLSKGSITTVEPDEVYNSTEGVLPEDEIIGDFQNDESLIKRPAEFKALQSSFGGLSERFLEKQYKALEEKMGRGVLSFLTTFKNMSNVDMYRAINTWFLGKVAHTEDVVVNISSTLNKLDAVQKAVAYKYFLTSKGEGSILSEKDFTIPQINALKKYKKTIEDLGQSFVDMGLLNKETYEKNKGAYLHTVYLDFINEYKGSGKKLSMVSYLRKRKNKNEREKFALGEIKDVAYLVPETIGVMMRDHALLSMFSSINSSSSSAKTYWVLTKDTKVTLPWDNRKKITLERAYEWATDLQDIVNGVYNNEELRSVFQREPEEISQLKEDLEELNKRIEAIEDTILQEAYDHAKVKGITTAADKESFIKDHYIRMPYDRRWGDLKGKYVRKEIYDDLEAVTSSYRLDAMSSNIEKFLAPGGLLERMNRFWKKTMVMYNPGSWSRNIVGNFSLLDLSTPTNAFKLIKMLHEEIDKSFKTPSEFWELAKSHGLFGTSYSAIELQDIYGKYQDKINRALDEHSKAPKSSWDHFFAHLDPRMTAIIEIGKDIAVDKYHRTDNTLSKWYSLVEGAFKTVAFRDYVQRWEQENNQSYKTLSKDKQEMLFLKATNHANKAIFNYSEVPGFVKFLRRTPFGSPFLTFTYKAAPLMVESMMTNPVKFAKYAALPSMVTMIAQAAFDWDDDDINKFKSRLPEYYRNNPGVAFIPFKDEKGRPQILPLDYMIPWSPIWTAASKSYANYMKTEGEGIVGPAVQAGGTFIDEFGFLGGPAPDMITAWKSGKDSFTGRDIITPGASPNQQLFEMMKYSSNMFLPAWLANGGWFGKMYDSMVTKRTNQFGELTMTPLQAVSDITGFRARSVLERGGLESRKKEFEMRLREVGTYRNKIIKDRNIDYIDKVSKMKDIAQREKMIREQMRKALQGNE